MTERNLAYPVLLISEELNGKHDTGSGFYYIENEAVYFVTAKHVLFDYSSVQLNELPKSLKIPYHIVHKLFYDTKKKILIFTDVMTSQEKDELLKTVPDNKPFKDAIELLYEKSQQPLLLKYSKATLYSYPPNLAVNNANETSLEVAKLFKVGKIKYHPSSDIAIIEIAKVKMSGERGSLEYIDGLTSKKGGDIVGLPNSLIKKFDELLIGNTVFTFGYPTAISKNNTSLDIKLPLLRKGIIAGRNNALKLIILDSPAFGGNSGGLILEVEKDFKNLQYNEKYWAIGIITQFVPFLKEDSVNAENSGYSIGVPMDAILELLNKENKK